MAKTPYYIAGVSLVVGFCLGVLTATAAHASESVVGVHISSIHIPASSELKDANPGIYFRHESGATAGVYRNSLGRTSFYAGYTTERGPFALTLGVISGYQLKRVYGQYACAQEGTGVVCTQTWTESGNTKGAIGPLVAPSVRLPSIFDITPRITVLPKFATKGHTVLHLSVERAF